MLELNVIRDYSTNIEVVTDGMFAHMGFDLRAPVPATLTYAGNLAFFEQTMGLDAVTAIITTPEVYETYTQVQGDVKKGVALSNRPQEDFFRFHNHLCRNTDFYERRVEGRLGLGCQIAKLSSIAARNVVIGDRVVIEDFVRICENVTIGDDTIIRAGSVIGNDGFQFLHLPGEVLKVEHVGGVCIGRNVEIQCSCTVDKHIFDADTVVGDDTKFDNFVYFAHASKIGVRGRVGDAHDDRRQRVDRRRCLDRPIGGDIEHASH